MFCFLATAATRTIALYRPVEIQLQASDATYGVGSGDYLGVEFQHADGMICDGQGFHDGADVWRIRFSPPRIGAWHWRTTSGDKLLNGCSGMLVVEPTHDSNVFLRHGPVTTNPGRQTLVHADQTPFFWLGDTVWEAPAGATAAEWDVYLARRVEQGFSVIQMNSLPQWDAALPHRRQPFLQVSDRLDPDYFDNGEIIQVMQRNRDKLLRVMLRVLRRDKGRMMTSQADHRGIAEALLVGDSALAIERVHNHLNYGKGILLT